MMINTLTCVVFFKIVSFFHVVNDVHDFIVIIKKEKLDRNDNHFYFKKSQISISVGSEITSSNLLRITNSSGSTKTIWTI